ncbi:response regulator [Anaerolineales bacterium HSG24]|nr:response regulator [Anaerolineales bacterium HSG24]
MEDNAQNALLMKRILEARGHNVLHAEEGATGFEMATKEVPDIILVDLGLPDMDGQTLIGVIRNEPTLKDIPMVTVTAWPEETARALAEAYGCQGCISKPINSRTFPDQIEAFLP